MDPLLERLDYLERRVRLLEKCLSRMGVESLAAREIERAEKALENKGSVASHAETPTEMEWIQQFLVQENPAVLQQAPLERFTHIIRALEESWNIRGLCRDFIDQLLVDKRGGRKGFPLDTLMDIVFLKNILETIENDERLDPD